MGELRLIGGDRRTDVTFAQQIRPFEKGGPEERGVFHTESFERSVVCEVQTAALLGSPHECTELRPRHIVRGRHPNRRARRQHVVRWTTQDNTLVSGGPNEIYQG